MSRSRKAHIAFTVATRSYLAGALVWRKSLADSGSGIRGLIYLVDAKVGELPALCEEARSVCLAHADGLENDLRSVESTQIPDDEGMRERYEIIEYCTAIKPSIFLALAAEFPGNVLHYFDPDIAIFGDLAALRNFSEAHSFTLTPHMTTPTDDHFRLSQLDVLRAGVFNFGYLGWNPGVASALPLMAWWQRRLNKDSRIALSEGIFVDQSWGVMFCSSPESGIFHDVAHNVAYWNLHERDIAQHRSRFTCNGKDLQFYHFSGFSPLQRDKLSLHQDRHVLRGLRGPRALCHWYADELFAAGYRHWREAVSAQDRVDKALFAAGFRRGDPSATTSKHRPDFSFEARRKAQSRVEEIFGEPRAFLIRAGIAWWIEFVAARASMAVAGDNSTRYRELTGRSRLNHEKAENLVQKQIDQKGLLGLGVRYWWNRFLMAISQFAVLPDKEKSSALAEVVEDSSQLSAPAVAKHELAVVGYITAETGLGESVRGIIRALDAAGKAADLYDIKLHYARSEDREFAGRVHAGDPTDSRHGACLAHINADQVPWLLPESPVNLLAAAERRIGYWYWETERLPHGQESAARYFDEIWVATRFVHDSVMESGVRVPVRVIPPSLSDLPSELAGREHFGLPLNRQVCLSVFDATSFLGRKNPLGVIRAMQRVYQKTKEKPLLVLKTTNLKEDDRKRLVALASPVEIVFMNLYISREETLSLISAADCFISLHRAEGLGLSLVDAMRLGTPLVSTDYSGPRDFATEDNAFLVPWTRCAARWEDGPYFGSTWAEPDIAAAADSIASALERSDQTREKIRLAKATVENHFSRARTGTLLAEVLG